MILNPWLGGIFEIIPTVIKTAIISILIFSVFFYMVKRKKTNSENGSAISNSDIYMSVFGVYIKKRTINKVLLVLGGLPLLVYPIIIIANIMSLSALEFSNSVWNAVVTLIFIIFTGSYLPVYIICFALYFSKKDKSILVSVIPLVQAAAIFLLLI